MRTVAISLTTLLLVSRAAPAQREAQAMITGGGSEIVAVFITGPCCERLVPMLRPGLDRMRAELAERARREDVGLRMVGVTNHWSADSGWAHLKEYGSFDEVTVGSNWLNSAIATLVWRDGNTTPSIPQVLIYRHSVGGGPGLRFGPPEVIEQVKGWDAIRDWGLNKSLVP